MYSLIRFLVSTLLRSRMFFGVCRKAVNYCRQQHIVVQMAVVLCLTVCLLTICVSVVIIAQAGFQSGGLSIRL